MVLPKIDSMVFGDTSPHGSGPIRIWRFFFGSDAGGVWVEGFETEARGVRDCVKLRNWNCGM